LRKLWYPSNCGLLAYYLLLYNDAAYLIEGTEWRHLLELRVVHTYGLAVRFWLCVFERFEMVKMDWNVKYDHVRFKCLRENAFKNRTCEYTNTNIDYYHVMVYLHKRFQTAFWRFIKFEVRKRNDIRINACSGAKKRTSKPDV
jgi:hypothetical protein